MRTKTKYSPEASDWIMETIQTIERQYPNQFDKEVYKILSTTQNKSSLRHKKRLSKILKNTMTYKGKYAVFDKLYHPNPELRAQALIYLKENYDKLRDTDKEIIKSSFMERLNDDNVKVVEETLSVIEKTSIVDKDDLKPVLINLLNKCVKLREDWDSISKKVIMMLVNVSDPNDWEPFLALFPSLILKSKYELKFCKKILKRDYFSKHPVYKTGISKILSSHDHDGFVKIFLKTLQANGDVHNLKSFLEVLKKQPEDKTTTYHKYVSFLILSSLLPKNSTLEVGAEILESLQAFTNNVVDIFDKEGTVVDYLEAAQSKVPVHGYLRCVRSIFKKITKPEWKLSTRDFSETNSENTFFLYVVNLVITNENYLKVFLDYFCKGLQEKVNTILNFCGCQNGILKSNFVTDSLTYLKEFLAKMDPGKAKQLLFIEENTALSLLILLHNPNNEIRRQIFEVMKFFVDITTRKSSSYYYLFEGLLKHQEEIIVDSEQVPLIIFNILDPTNTKGKKHVADLNSIRNRLIKMLSEDEYPLYMKCGILKLTSLINTYDILEESSKLSLKILQENVDEVKGFKSDILIGAVNRIHEKVVKKINLDSSSWNLIENYIKNDKTKVFIEDTNVITPSPLVLNHLDKEILKVFEESIMAKLLDVIIEIASVAQNPEVLPAASKIFKHIDLDAQLVLDQLTKMKEVQSPKLDSSKKKIRGSIIPTVDILDTLEWKKGLTVLEFIQDKKKIRNTNALLPVLFDLLKKCLDFDEQIAVEYPKQLLLSSILNCCEKSQEDFPESVFNMELIVQCIRISQNPQTHHHALLVLAHTAQLIPNQVLHHMMTIFTFMGSSVLRHDDAYSFQIITKIINTIIPILVEDNQENNIAKVLRVFVDVLLDVPEHRRMPLYQRLLEKIEGKENLYLFLLLVFESQVLNSNNQKEIAQKRLEIAADLCRTFPPDTVIYTCIKLMKYLQNLPDEKEEVKEVDGAFNITTHTAKDFRHFKYLLVKFVANLLGSHEFVNQIAALNEDEELALENLFKEMIINTLQYIQRISKVVEKNANTPQEQYWKVLLNLTHDILDSINALVTPQMFLLVTKGLMVHNLANVRRRILELLNNKLQYDVQFFAECDKNEIFSLIPPIISIIEKLTSDIEHEQEVIIQTALLSLKLLVKSQARENPSKFVPVLQFITLVMKSGKAQNNVLASLILCLAELCVHMRALALSSLPDFMPAVIKILKQQKKEETPSVLLKSVITTIDKILDSLALFLSPYLQKLLFELTILITKWNLSADEHKTQPLVTRINNIKQKMGSLIPLRVLLQAVVESFNMLVSKKCYSAIGELMDILSETLNNLKGRDVNNSLADLTNFFLEALKFRTEHESSSDSDNMEKHIIKAFTIVILKLSESSFRPIYYKLYDWAVRSEIKSERIITFYNLSSHMAESLKGLFVLFAGHFVNNAAQVLDACNTVKNTELYFEDDAKNVLLLENVLKTLNAVFLYDTQRFVSKDRFDVLMQPLVDQLENTLGGLESLEERNRNLLTPCIVNFSIATADDSLWKQMNYQILLKLRHNEAKIRLVALHCLNEIVKKIGEDFLPLLPETIPFLAELLEDEDENVEKACQQAVREMEKVLGEPLQKYF